MAAWTSFLIENGKIGDLEKIYVKQAKEAADEVKSERNVETATEIYNEIIALENVTMYIPSVYIKED